MAKSLPSPSRTRLKEVYDPVTAQTDRPCATEGRVRETAIRIRDRWWLELRESLARGCDEDSCSPEGDASSSLYSFFRYQLGNLPGAYALIFSMGASSVPFEAAVRIYSRRSRPIPSRLS